MRGASYVGLPPAAMVYRRRVTSGSPSSDEPDESDASAESDGLDAPDGSDGPRCVKHPVKHVSESKESEFPAGAATPESGTSQSPSSVGGSSSRNRHGRPAKKSSAASRLVMTPRCVMPSAR